MKQHKFAGTILVTVPLFFILTFSAWAEPEIGSNEVSAASAKVIVATDDMGAADTADATEVTEAVEATGLDIVMDGSSLDAFEKSLEKVRETGSEDEYKGLKGAFEYLLIYDIGAKRDPEKLASRLDGLTGHEILNRVKWGQ
jgi:hypothetical protein